MATRRSVRSAPAAPAVAVDIPATQESEDGSNCTLPAKVKQLAELSGHSGPEKENLVNNAIPVAKRLGRGRKPKVLQPEVVAAAASAAPASAAVAAKSSAEGVKAAKKTSKKKVVLPVEGGEEGVEAEGDAGLKKEATGVTKNEVDAVIEDLQSFEISTSSRPARKTAVRVNYKVLNETGERQRMHTTTTNSGQ